MNNQLEERFQVHGALKQMLSQFMAQNNISATVMDDAITKILLDIREVAHQELIFSLQQDKIKEETDGGSEENSN